LLYELDQYRIELGIRPKSGTRRKGFTKIVFDLPRSVDESFQESLSTQLVTHTTATWMYFYGLLVRFQEENRHLLVPVKHKTSEGYGLGSWVNRQRTRQDSLDPELKKRLDALGFIWDSLAERWEVGFAVFVAFEEENGHCRVPQTHTTSEGHELGAWVLNQRQTKDSMDPERKARLDALGFIWDPLAERWEKGFAALVAFKEENGHCRVPQTHTTSEGHELGGWINRQRGTKDSMDPERKARLDALGFIWAVRKK
jgi:hypothetical protein